MVLKPCEYAKNHLVPFKWMDSMVCKLHLIEAVKK